MKEDIPFAFGADFYRDLHPDLATMTAEMAAEPLSRRGINEVRQGHPAGHRPAFVARLATLAPEVGLFCNPVMHGGHGRYLDMLDAGQIRAQAVGVGMDATGCPAQIHRVGGMVDVNEVF